ncbi:D-2-hydroxyacid dehydrogenase [Cumulibacter manganitolerans]|uniref:D-2-hydroxyacid dehydrogenase n=1 Tax=Cumulibacter manganitolerans TaxID=1884992 RepID=UPI001297F872|nr:D-2-hydroxyacid dehydrogenase [Cumulibacter manganitolerans]
MSSKVRITVAVPMSEALVSQIEAVDPRVEVHYDPAHFPGPRRLGDHHGAPAQPRSDAERDRFFEYLSHGEIVYGIPELQASGLRRIVEQDPRLRWVHAAQAGAGAFVTEAHLDAEQLARVLVTTSAGVHAEPLAEFAMLGMLAGSQDLARLRRQQAAHEWADRHATAQLRGATCLVLGAGEIGAAIASRAKAFGMRTVGIKRRIEPVAGFDDILGVEALTDAVRDADYVVVTLPGTAHTEHLVDARVIAACKPGVVVVNVGRGSVIDEAALVAALRSGHVASAALDVFEREPLEPASPLWDLPNVIVSPHTAALDVGEEQRVADLFCDNLRRYLDGTPLRNVVDVQQGY